MRETQVLMISRYLVNGVSPKNGRRLVKYPFPYTGILPMSLRNHVSGKGNKSKSAPCVFEIGNILACLEANSFNESPCLKEIESLKTCQENYLESARVAKAQEREGVLIPGAKHFSSSQMTKLLKKYPQPDVKL